MDEWGRRLRRSRFLSKVSLAFFVFGAFLIFVSFVPSVWFFVKSSWGEGVESNSRQIYETSKSFGAFEEQEEKEYLPRFEASLSKTNMLMIPSISVETEIREASRENFEDALRLGVWRVSDSGTPRSESRPLVLVAHRFGYLRWSNSYRRKNSFFNLPKVKEGDIVEVVWRQRKYVYSVYKTEEGKEIGDYEADIILYTCLDLSSDIRVFVYGKLFEI
jgi:sortase (surface protein transpeptidase)